MTDLPREVSVSCGRSVTEPPCRGQDLVSKGRSFRQLQVKLIELNPLAICVREQLLTLSDYDYQCSYSILESPMGVENYVATLKLTPVTDGNRTFAEWSAEFDCAPERERELAQNIGQGVFQAGFDALKSLLRK